MFNEDAKLVSKELDLTPDHPGSEQAPGGAHPHVRRALSLLLRGLYRPTHRQGL